ncbi:uncharacterized protein SCODWIG_01302 [Saccharomycodes ludwigii]|uniref:SURP motif domain-containing protein n=1 Tax=Saccharomycodes ludwigii TaxID=36035 RepID=A0A376B4H3_9ASCO|nr:hypothetical protein SCDLUD_004044 [Saccharomycodes ludwigii]KAH3899756.1 hypothetical protein SCDLUD_004044 [Saccharomycodes ludwigii]SSD59541.1 uncharacterized protein SCODWIG_01302 [Saccharomycodes ludwigii]
MPTLQDLEQITTPEEILIPSDNNIKQNILKTVLYVIQHGSSFEENIYSKEPGKFSFINPGDMYYEYYRYITDHSLANTGEQKDTHLSLNSNEERQNPNIIKPHDSLFSSYKNTYISKKDLEIIKATAVMCATYDDTTKLTNRKTTYSKIYERYKDNPQFEFMEAEHSLYSTFKSFVDQYTLLFNKGKSIQTIKDLKTAPFKENFMEKCFERAYYNEYIQEKRISDNNFKENIKLRFAAIDWDVFKVIDVITLEDTVEEKGRDLETSGKFKPALNFDDLAKNVLLSSQSNILSKYFEDTEKDGLLKIAMENKQRRRRKKRNIIIKEAGATRLTLQASESINGAVENDNSDLSEQVMCPITGKSIPAVHFEEHLRTLLHDPNHREEIKKYEDKNKLTNLSEKDVYENIKKLIQKESLKDDTTTTTEMVKKKRKILWDGHKNSVKYLQPRK